MRIKRGIRPQVAEIGKIKIGMKSDKKTASGFNLPKKLNHFLIVRTDRDQARVNYIPDEEVMATLGKEPTEIPIILPFDDPELIFQTSFALYQGRTCQCRGDGETAEMLFLKDGKPSSFTLLDTEENGDTVQKNTRRKIVCDPELCSMRQPDAQGNVKCKPNGRLCAIIPASKRLNGFYFFRTTSYNTISYITKALDDMKAQTGGILRGVPAKLFFFKKNTEAHGNVPVVSIDWDFDEISKMRQAVLEERKARTEFQLDVKILEDQARASGILRDNDDPEEVEKEFYPENTREYREQKKAEETDIKSRASSVLSGVEEIEIEDADIQTDEMQGMVHDYNSIGPTSGPPYQDNLENAEAATDAEDDKDLDLFS